MPIKNHKDLIVWQKAIELVKEVYKIVKQFPSEEKFILVSQMTRAAISIASNIAEGWARNHKLEFIRFLNISFGSATELETQLIIAKSEYSKIDYTKAEGLVIEVQKMLGKLISNTKASDKTW
jgi:four helix bundle protein